MIGSTRFLLSATATAAGLLLANVAFAVGPANVEHANGRALTAASNAPAAQAVAGYLASRGRSGAVVSSLREHARSGGAHGVTHLRMEQVVGGLVVHGNYVKAAVNARGEVTHVISRLSEVSAVAPSSIDAGAALRVAVAHVHPNAPGGFTPAGNNGNTSHFKGDAFFHGNPNVTAIALPQPNGGLAQGWLVETWEEKSNQLYHTVIDGSGNVVEIEKRTASDSYNVYLADPGKGPQTIVNGPAPGGASPNGWLAAGSQSTVNIVGNNVNAYLDADNNNRADRGGSTVSNGNFVTAANLTVAPNTTGNMAVSVQNLFYLNNRAHDILYGYGFNEAAGNFQSNNFGKGGLGADAVAAEAQDGGGTDNANFATPADGKPPRMQMYLWNGLGPTHEVKVNTPTNVTYGAKGAEFGAALTTTGVTGAVVRATPADGCTAISGVSGKVALIDRGTCDFVTKVTNAQAAGATAVIVANNTGGTETFVMGGTARLKIGAVMISQNDGNSLKAIASPNASVRKKAVQPLQLDGALDSDIVFHEYGHGLTWRMIGGMSGPLAGAIGEGASDGVAMLINGQPVVGVYASSTPNGIRRYRYDNYPLHYGNVDGQEVHNDGEIYAAIVWKMIELFGPSRRADLFRYYVDGMNYTPATPTYEQMRDGILQSVANGTNKSDCSLVWQAFAQYGVGVGAKGVVNSSTSVTITPSFTTPASCN